MQCSTNPNHNESRAYIMLHSLLVMYMVSMNVSGVVLHRVTLRYMVDIVTWLEKICLVQWHTE